MFDFDGFGRRLQNLRMQKNMTQGDLADRIGVTAQAVSKWENDLSYPDITILPTLATIFNVEINYLFGIEKKDVKADVKFPKTYDNMNLVHQYHNIACYSSKKVDSIDGSGVKFTDGSAAELSNKLVVNAGKGEIKLLVLDEIDANIDFSKTSRNYEFDYLDSLDIEVLSNKCEIVRSSDNKCRVHANGEVQFIKMMEVLNQEGTLIIRFDNKDGYNNNSYHKNTVKIELPCEIGKTIRARVNGSGELLSEINRFETGKLIINGSGIINMIDFDSCISAINGSGIVKANKTDIGNFSINGSGNIEWENVGKLEASINGSGNIKVKNTISPNININGSGNIELDNLSGDGEAYLRISGSGNIKVLKGYCKKLDVVIKGNGDINASGITVNKASIVIDSNGKVTIGRVIESSTEQVKRKGIIEILKRGKE